VVGLALILVAPERLVAAAVGVAVSLRVAAFTVAVVCIGFDRAPVRWHGGGAQRQPGHRVGFIVGATMVAGALAFGITALFTRCRSGEAEGLPLAIPAASAGLLAVVAVDGSHSRVDGGIMVGWYLVAAADLRSLGRRGATIEPKGDASEALDIRQHRYAEVLLVVSLALLVAGSELLAHSA
jgi:cation:H+ antiporter